MPEEFTALDWYRQNNCSHAHCPNDCEHPQPFIRNGKLYCGYCGIVGGVLEEMIPCTPENCNEATTN